jgi:hypothetical protein
MIPSLFYVYNENINVESKIAHGRWAGKEVHRFHHCWAVLTAIALYRDNLVLCFKERDRRDLVDWITSMDIRTRIELRKFYEDRHIELPSAKQS